MIELSADGIHLTFDPRIGQIVEFAVADHGVTVSPLHKAPWVGSDEPISDRLPPHLKTLGGDFFCAPFGQETEEVPLHGWTANSEWHVEYLTRSSLRARLQKTVNGAQIVKELSLRSGHPFIYQRHTFFGDPGPIPLANHANVSLPHGGVIRTSRKRVWCTPSSPLESDPDRGRSGLRYPAHASDPKKFPALEGTADLTQYPWFPRHEDFVIGIEAPGLRLGWTAVTRPIEGDLFLSLRDARALPMTMLWHSNGGRDYAPWSGRHVGCLGVEEGFAPHLLGSILDEASLRDPDRGPLVSVTHVLGALHWATQDAIASVSLTDSELQIRGADQGARSVPIWPDALFGGTIASD